MVDMNALEADPLVAVIDYDAKARESMKDLLQSAGLRVVTFALPPELATLATAACLVLDVRLTRCSGLEVQKRLSRAGIETPVIFTSRSGDVVTSVKAMKAGALDFLQKPFRDQDMLDAVLAAVSLHEERRLAARRNADLKTRFARLTNREREVMVGVTKGLLNKQIAGQLRLSDVTVKMYRKRVMTKMNVLSLADLVRCAETLGLHMDHSSANSAAESWPGPFLRQNGGVLQTGRGSVGHEVYP